jgi:hypothetical protein
MGTMSASDAAPLPRLGEVFFDVRGNSRSMRLSWYADTGVAVLSIWQGGMCTGTFRLAIGDLPRMVETLQRGPGGQQPHWDAEAPGQADAPMSATAQVHPMEPLGHRAPDTQADQADYLTGAQEYPGAAHEYAAASQEYPAGPPDQRTGPPDYLTGSPDPLTGSPDLRTGRPDYLAEPRDYLVDPAESQTGSTQYLTEPPDHRAGPPDYLTGSPDLRTGPPDYLAETPGEPRSGPTHYQDPRTGPAQYQTGPPDYQTGSHEHLTGPPPDRRPGPPPDDPLTGPPPDDPLTGPRRGRRAGPAGHRAASAPDYLTGPPPEPLSGSADRPAAPPDYLTGPPDRLGGLPDYQTGSPDYQAGPPDYLTGPPPDYRAGPPDHLSGPADHPTGPPERRTEYLADLPGSGAANPAGYGDARYPGGSGASYPGPGGTAAYPHDTGRQARYPDELANDPYLGSTGPMDYPGEPSMPHYQPGTSAPAHDDALGRSTADYPAHYGTAVTDDISHEPALESPPHGRRRGSRGAANRHSDADSRFN